MKKTIITLMGMGLASFSAQAQITDGDVIAIDFGTIATTEANWNTSVTSATLTVTDLIRLSDGFNTTVGLDILATAGGAISNNTSVFDNADLVTATSQGGSSILEIRTDGIIGPGAGNDEFTLTFTGLDDTLTYDLFAGGLTEAADVGGSWNINTTADISTTQETNFQNATGYVDFTGITSVGGEFTLTINDLSDAGSPASGRNIGISELTLTAVAVPEPSSTALLGLGGLALLLRRRK